MSELNQFRTQGVIHRTIISGEAVPFAYQFIDRYTDKLYPVAFWDFGVVFYYRQPIREIKTLTLTAVNVPLVEGLVHIAELSDEFTHQFEGNSLVYRVFRRHKETGRKFYDIVGNLNILAMNQIVEAESSSQPGDNIVRVETGTSVLPNLDVEQNEQDAPDYLFYYNLAKIN